MVRCLAQKFGGGGGGVETAFTGLKSVKKGALGDITIVGAACVNSR